MNIGHKKPLAPGTRFGRLIIESFLEQRLINGEKKIKKAYYNCICDCGNKKIVMIEALQSKGTKSCGCLGKESNRTGDKRRLPKDTASFNNLFYSYKRSAKKRNFRFELTEEEFKSITKSNCYYCNSIPVRQHTNKKNKTYTVPYICNGIDRIDSSKGYIIDNVRPCCFPCNTAKSDLTEHEFFDMIKKIYSNRRLNVL